MNIVAVAAAFSEIVAGLQTIGVLNADGTFNPTTVEQDAKVAALAVTILEKNGIDVPDKVEKYVRVLPAFIELLS